jgi:hypothetical protein
VTGFKFAFKGRSVALTMLPTRSFCVEGFVTRFAFEEFRRRSGRSADKMPAIDGPVIDGHCSGLVTAREGMGIVKKKKRWKIGH